MTQKFFDVSVAATLPGVEIQSQCRMMASLQDQSNIHQSRGKRRKAELDRLNSMLQMKFTYNC